MTLRSIAPCGDCLEVAVGRSSAAADAATTTRLPSLPLHPKTRVANSRLKSKSFHSKFKNSVKACGAHYPMMHASEAEKLFSFLKDSDRVLEYGSGRSSCVLAKFVRSLDSIEDNKFWAATVAKEILNDNQRVHHVPRIGPNRYVKGNRPPSSLELYSDYVEFPKKLAAQEKFDVVFDDGRCRPQAARLAYTDLLKDDGILIVHDFEGMFPFRPYYRIILRWFYPIDAARTLWVFVKRPSAEEEQRILPEWWFKQLDVQQMNVRESYLTAWREPFGLNEISYNATLPYEEIARQKAYHLDKKKAVRELLNEYQHKYPL